MTTSIPDGWHKSSKSGQQTNCVEVGHVAEGAAVRDTKHRAAGHFIATGDQWSAFVLAIKTGRYER
ncbi:DUF397 domain-containing protein [Saccharopolyspora gloriosae]|uniref:DUF397 domain-containing protein n=1 Tax=Saccharopolyspora gloriosae TaxID=455344 RepID=UPI001FB639E0|nr:DUF397 domain-containing protein [Saccharopolyspora gloriosae]